MGTVRDKADKIDFRQSFQECVLIEHAHRVVHVDNIGIFILSGNLTNLHNSKGTGRRVD